MQIANSHSWIAFTRMCWAVGRGPVAILSPWNQSKSRFPGVELSEAYQRLNPSLGITRQCGYFVLYIDETKIMIGAVCTRSFLSSISVCISDILTIFSVIIVDPRWAKVKRPLDGKRGSLNTFSTTPFVSTTPVSTTATPLILPNHPRATTMQGNLDCFPLQGCGKYHTTNAGRSGDSMTYVYPSPLLVLSCQFHINIPNFFVRSRIADFWTLTNLDD